MSLVRAEADLIRLCTRAGLGDGQRALLEAVLAASNPEAVLTQHVTSEPIAVAAIARVHSALESRARPGRAKPQPFLKPMLDLVQEALATINMARPHFPSGQLDGAVTALQAMANETVKLDSAADCGAQVVLLSARVAELRSAAVDGFAAAWRGTASADAGKRLALEIAALCVMEGRQYQLLSDDLRTELSRGMLDADKLLQVLLPTERDVRVAVVVEGASRLDSLERLMDSASVVVGIAPGEPVGSWGRGTTDLQELADLAEAASETRRSWSRDQAGGRVLLTFTVRARDLGGAALLGRRRASELLDQYVAGQRIAEIRLRPETLAYDLSADRKLRLAVPSLGTGPVRPLTTGWPATLRESLRTAHIARVTEAPTTAAGLCWAALEALDVKPNSVGQLARALSLQAVRQQLLDLHQRMRTVVAAEVEAARTSHREAQRRSEGLDAAARAATGEHTTALSLKAATVRATERERLTALKQAIKAEAHLAVLDAWTGVGNDGLLRSPDRWLDAFAAPDDAESKLCAAAMALAAIADFLSGETAARLQSWRAMLADPGSLALWIKETEVQFKKSLDWLYVLRNTALHDGRFASATDLLDVQAGRALVDLTLEFLGNWYQHEAKAAPDRVGLTAIEVIAHLAERQEQVVRELCSGNRAGWNVTRLTSPTSTGWDR